MNDASDPKRIVVRSAFADSIFERALCLPDSRKTNHTSASVGALIRIEAVH